MRIKLNSVLITIFLLVVIFHQSTAQTQNLSNIDISRIDVDALSDEQVDRILYEMEKRGLDEQDMELMAQSQGVAPAQIEKLKARLRKRKISLPTNVLAKDFEEADTPDEELLSVREDSFDLPPPEQRVFGISIFNSEQLTFEPGSHLTPPKDYQLSTGDEIIVDIWGASKQNYQGIISRKGTVTIGNLGPVYLSGLTVEKASEKVKQRLSEIYRGLGGSQPNTFFQLSIGELRNINVIVLGEVRTPGTYTISSMATAFNALYLSGGPSENGSLRKIEVIRDNKVVSQIDVYDFLFNGNQKQNIHLRDRDIIRVNAYESRVNISGEVKRPMLYEMNDKESLQDLIRFASGFTDHAYSYKLKVRRKTSRAYELKVVNQDQYDSFLLENGDEVEVDSILQKYTNLVSIKGAVYHPGDYELKDSLTISGLIEQAEGLRDYAFTSRGLLYRTMQDYSIKVLSFDVNNILNDPSQDIVLENEDVVEIKSLFEMEEQAVINISGAVLAPGEYPFFHDMTLSDLIMMANGFTEGALTSRIEIGRRIQTRNTNGAISEVILAEVDPKLGIDDENANNFILEPYDQVYVRKDPAYEVQSVVRIEGEVEYPGTYVIRNSNEYLSDIFVRAGGLTEFAFVDGAVLERASLTDSIFVGIDLKEILNNPKSKKDMIVKGGDIIYVPQELQTVSVEGAVLNAIAIKYNGKPNFKDYINFSGGYASDAKKNKAYVTYPNGVSERIKRRMLFFKSYPEIKPGSKIIVPEKELRDQRITAQEILAFTTGIATISLLVQRLVE